jgi:hypothetical protein
MARIILLCVSLVFCATCGIGLAAEGSKDIAAGDWSEPVTDNRGFAVRGRLVLAEKPRGDGRRQVAVYIELQDASDHVGSTMQIFCDLGRTDFREEYKGGLRCELRDKDKKLVPPMVFAFSGGVPGSVWMTLPSDSTIRLRTTPYGIHREGALAICPGLHEVWAIENDDAAEYFLSGTFTVDPSADKKPPADGQVWRGTLVLPPMRVVSQRK